MFRQVNERIKELNDAFGEMSGEFVIVCECADRLCAEQIDMSRQEYDLTRATPAQFILKPGHEVADVEEIIATEADYVVVENNRANLQFWLRRPPAPLTRCAAALTLLRDAPALRAYETPHCSQPKTFAVDERHGRASGHCRLSRFRG